MSDAPGYLDFMGILPEEDFPFDSGRPVYCYDGVPVVEPGPLVDVYAKTREFSYPWVDNAEKLPVSQNVAAWPVATTIVNSTDVPMTVLGRMSYCFGVKYNPAGSTRVIAGVAGYRQPMAAGAGGTRHQSALYYQGLSGYGVTTSAGYAAALDRTTSWALTRRLAFPSLNPGERYDIYPFFEFSGSSNPPPALDTSHTIYGGSWGFWVAGVAGGI